MFGVDRRVEVKVRADGFRELYKWLDGADLLVVHSDRHKPLVVVPIRDFVAVLIRAEEHRANRKLSDRAVCPNCLCELRCYSNGDFETSLPDPKVPDRVSPAGPRLQADPAKKKDAPPWRLSDRKRPLDEILGKLEAIGDGGDDGGS